MMVHEFVKCSILPSDKFYRSLLEDNNYLKISDEYIFDNSDCFNSTPMYTNDLKTPHIGLSHFGISIIDPIAAKGLIDSLIANGMPCGERERLISYLSEAINENMLVVHFGI